MNKKLIYSDTYLYVCYVYNKQGPDLYAFIGFIGFIGPDDDDLN